MTFLALVDHLLNFMAPALVMALLLWGMPRVWPKVRKARWASRKELLVLGGLGLAVLLAGLIVFGRDAKMITYTALVLVQGSVAWWVRR